ncbi:MAG: YchJ family protein [Pseudomonadota bacterium]
MSDLCYCNSGVEFGQCCEPLIKGKKKAQTAEQLMRSRYTAFAIGEMDYIVDTHHPSSRDSVDVQGNQAWSKGAEWKGLEIRSTIGGEESDSKGQVEFVASFDMDGEEKTHHELSDFKKEKGEWFFVDGKLMTAETFVREQPKVGRNDPCVCGSGKKYKKCCGAAA